MARFCTKCGKELEDGKRCTCQPQFNAQETLSKGTGFLSTLLSKMGLNNPFSQKDKQQKIVPDAIKQTDGEIPIKQYNLATLRSRIRGQYAKGKLQITNKRVIFRADGLSYKGNIKTQNEFDLNKISGVEIKKTNRISPLNIILSVILTSAIISVFAGLFAKIGYESEWLGLFCSIVFGLACTVPFFIFKKKFWIKLLFTSCGYGAVLGNSGLIKLSEMSFLFGIDLNIADLLACVVLIVWFLNLILVALVPDLIITIKTDGAAEAITIRRKQFATLFKQEIEYSGFSEVLPGVDVDVATEEIGALINDIQTFGDTGIEKWKED